MEIKRNIMKIFLISLTDDRLKDYDCYWAHVVVASNEEEARTLVNNCSNGDEKSLQEDCWLNPKFSSCNEITLDQSIVILSDFHAG